jgi:methionyl-tRNA formyltransferase
MKIFLFIGSRRGYAILKKMIALNANICGILCLIEDPHEDQYHPRITEIALEHQIPIFYSDVVKPGQYAEVVEKCAPDIAFAIGWRFLINKKTYSLPPKGTLIIHDSLLPKYRGFAPTNWAIINGETETGVTLFHIADDVDSGPIIDQLKTDISPTDTIRSVDEKVTALYEEIIEKNLAALANGTAKAKPQNEAEASFTCKRIPTDGRINWQQSAEKIYNLIRATSEPFPGAFAYLNGKKITIWEAALPNKKLNYAGSIPGRVLGKRDGFIEVLTGDGVLQIKRLQIEGEATLEAKNFPVSVKDTFC